MRLDRQLASMAFALPDAIQDEAVARLVGVDGDARAAAVAALAAEHPAHAESLRALSAVLQDTDRLLADRFTPPPPDDPASIGPFRVLRRLGDGAFGVVYLCAQDSPIRREVAVKVLRPGAGDRSTLARFEAERQMLVGFDHPTIARVYDAGALADGRPWFAMEHVDGLPLASYCDHHRLSIDARLRLFADLCDGVQHAHMRGIIHRDLKPQNVLVGERDGRPVPKIIDFGIAKALHTAASAPGPASVATAAGRVIGTPGYMSPEQAAGESRDIDTRADIFSLGVMLYELLAGGLPWRDRPPTPDRDPQRPSTRVRTDATRTDTIAGMRSTAPRSLIAKLRGDLDWIVLKALSPDRAHRYQSARALADDIGRHLRCEPVEACPPSASYKLAKLARRHVAAVAGVATILAALVAGLVISLVFYRQAEASAAEVAASLGREREARRVAEVGFDSALGAVDALLTRVADLRLAEHPQTEVVRRELFGDALRFYGRLLTDHADDKNLRGEMARVRNRVARLHLELGQLEQARAEATRVVDDLRALLAEADAPERPALHHALGDTYGVLAFAAAPTDAAAARTFRERAVQELEHVEAASPGDRPLALAAALCDLADSLSVVGERAASVLACERAVGVMEAAVAAQPGDRTRQVELLRCLARRASRLANIVDAAATEASFARLSQACENQIQLGDLDDELIRCLVDCWFNLGLSQYSNERYRESASAFELAIRWQRPLVERHPGIPSGRAQLGELYQRLAGVRAWLDEDVEAEVAVRTAVAIHRALVAEFPTVTLYQRFLAESYNQVVTVLLARGRRCDLGDAELMARQALALVRQIPDTAFPRSKLHVLGNAGGNLGHVLDACGREATAIWEEVTDVYRQIIARWPEVAVDHDNFARVAARLATRRLAAGDVDGAESVLDEARADRLQNPAARKSPLSHRNYARVLRLLALVAARKNDAARAAAMADEMEPWLGDWRVRRLAADALFAAWQAANAAATPDRDTVAEYAARADGSYESVIWELQPDFARGDPEATSTTCIWGEAHIRRAELLAAAGDHSRALPLAHEGLRALNCVRADIHANWWSDEIYLAGHVVAAQSHLTAGDVAAAAGAAATLAKALDGYADALFAAACIHAECAGRAQQSDAPTARVAAHVNAGLAALDRAVAHGWRDRARAAATPALAALRPDPRFSLVLGRMQP